MAIITVLHNQSFQDIAIEKTGNVLNAFSIAVANGYAVSDFLEPGTDLILPEEMEIDVDVLNYYASKHLQPATALRDQKVIEKRGIGIMKIGSNFKVD
ncbi:hypothetical protein [Chryseobacterium mulctrae]|uniref:hypothetical protein n=1 Tax=Chryseobacterium mulctrae TaxID=2576777 RepID=UPI00111610D1|nr:hypothetical protein [Chryseobacterium mulctrae]